MWYPLRHESLWLLFGRNSQFSLMMLLAVPENWEILVLPQVQQFMCLVIYRHSSRKKSLCSCWSPQILPWRPLQDPGKSICRHALRACLAIVHFWEGYWNIRIQWISEISLNSMDFSNLWHTIIIWNTLNAMDFENTVIYGFRKNWNLWI